MSAGISQTILQLILEAEKKICFSVFENPEIISTCTYTRERELEVKILLDYVQAFGKNMSLFMNAGAWDTVPLQNCEDLEYPVH